MLKNIHILPAAILLAAGSFVSGYAQKAPQRNWASSRILHEIKKLDHVGRVLYVAAHPDDENTRFIAYCVNDKGFETAYISLTRGDGGQDLIGPEVREKLGVIRTQELQMARETDGGQQFFSRANDFGFSKTADETFRIWNREQTFSDLVWAIRKFQPDIIVTRFSPTYTKTHGHHHASAILAQEAFSAAADAKVFPEQLAYVKPWQTKGMFWNTSTFFFQSEKFDTAGLYRANVGTYLPLLGKSIGELAAESRSMHKSQGFGSSPGRGDVTELFVYSAGEKPAGRDITALVDDKWSKIKGCEEISGLINTIIKTFDAAHPDKSIAALASLYKKLEAHKENRRVASKLESIENIMLQCAGVYSEAISPTDFWPVGDSAKVNLGVVVQSNVPVSVKQAQLFVSGNALIEVATLTALKANDYKTFKAGTVLPANTKVSGPYWLEDSIKVGMYTVNDQLMRGLPQNPHQVYVQVQYEIGGVTLSRQLPVFYKTTDPVKGELNSEVAIVPPVTVNAQQQLLVFSNEMAKEVKVKLKTFSDKGKVRVKLSLPQGWTATPEFIEADSKAGGAEKLLSFMVTPSAKEERVSIGISAEVADNVYNRSLETIQYDHIPRQVLLSKATVQGVKLNVIIKSKRIGYIAGAGDEVPDALRQLGYSVDVIAPAQLATVNLQQYDAMVAGVRAYNTIDRLKYDNPRILEYVKNGGNYVVQYNTSFNLVTKDIGPYELTYSHDRVTEEDAEVLFAAPQHPVLNTPNKITNADFTGWVQERGLYFPEKWAVEYTPILEMKDTGEQASKGSLLVADYGKGHFVYTGLSFFRELPVGVPGAYRLFVNLIELGK